MNDYDIDVPRIIKSREDLEQCDWEAVGNSKKFKRWTKRNYPHVKVCDGTGFYYVGFKHLETGCTLCAQHAKIMERYMLRPRIKFWKRHTKDNIEVFLVG